MMRGIFDRDALLVKVTCLGSNEDFALLLLSSLSKDTRVATQLILMGDILQLGEKHLEYLFGILNKVRQTELTETRSAFAPWEK